MILQRLWLAHWRNYAEADLAFDPGCTVVLGANGQGKTNLVEAIAYLATLESFRGAPGEALVERGATAAVVRAELDAGDRAVLIEAELPVAGRARAQVNRQRLVRARDLLGVLRVSVFHPDDLALVKGGPAERRRYLDEALSALHPRYDRLRSDVERTLRQRTTLLKQAGGRLTAEIELTLDVWDERLAVCGTALADARAELVAELAPALALGYAQVAGTEAPVTAQYVAPWRAPGLAAALAAARRDDVRRGVSSVGPHRDDVAIDLNRLPSRTHASQGEQRCLALGLRVAAHRVVAARTGTLPLLVLDDVFSELDEVRSRALLTHLPAGQIVLTTAVGLPTGAQPDRVVRIASGAVAA